MKNTIIITIDTERDTPIRIGKPDIENLPTTPEEQKEMMFNDINCVAETLCHLINTAADKGFCDKKTYMDEILVKIHGILTEEVDTEQEAFDKAKLVIDKIEAIDQLPAAQNFLDLFMDHFKNQEKYDELNLSLKEKEKSLTL